jgi:hypothetical protein
VYGELELELPLFGSGIGAARAITKKAEREKMEHFMIV